VVEVRGVEMPESHSGCLELARELGLKVNPETRRASDLNEVERYCREMQEKRDRLEYEVDGCVIKLDSLALQRRAGQTARAPRWAVAYKFPARQATTRVVAIEVQVGRTGALTPVAILDPVPHAGITISRCTLHNEEEIRRKGVNVGDTVLIERGGDVIPKIVKVTRKAEPPPEHPFTWPDRCPICGGKLFKEEEEVISRCTNVSCPARLRESLLHFASRRAMAKGGFQRAWKSTIRVIPASRTAAAMASASSAVVARGFSVCTCLPARAAATIGSRWAKSGVATATASTPGSRTISRKSV
jgi:DNA ligase (NAD+)